MSKIVHVFLLVSLAVSVTVLAGCATSGRADDLEKRIALLEGNQKSLQEDRKRLSETLTDSGQKINDLETIIKEARDLLSRNNADLGAEMIEVRKAIDRLSGQSEGLKRDHEKLVKEFDLFVQDVDTRLSGGAGLGPLPSDKNELFAEAEKRYQASNWAASRKAFMAFVRDHRSDKRADDAQLYIGQTFLRQGQYADAILEFRKVLENFRRSNVQDAAVFGSANAYAGLGRCDTAKALYENIISDYPRSKYRRDAAKLAKAITASGTCK